MRGRSFLRFLVVAALSGLGAAASAEPQTQRDVALFVSPDRGDDRWSGRLPEPNDDGSDGPLGTFAGARDAVRSIDRTDVARIDVFFRDGSAAQNARLSDGFRPTLARSGYGTQIAQASAHASVARAGRTRYFLAQPVELTAADSGTAAVPVVYQNFPGEQPIVSGGMAVTGWTPINLDYWKATLGASTAPFENLFVNGQRMPRPRLGGFLGAYGRVYKTVSVNVSEPNCPKMSSTDPGPYECFDRFEYADPTYAFPEYTLDPTTWGNVVLTQSQSCDPNLTAYPVGDVEVLIFEQFSTSKLRVRCVDTTNHIVYMTGPTAIPGATNAHETGFITGNRFIVENVKNALLQPGQWYLDPSGPAPALYYHAKPHEDPNREEIIAPQANSLIIGNQVHDVIFKGLTFEHDNWVVSPTGHVSTELEPDVTSALSFRNSSRLAFDHIVVRHTSGGGLDIVSCLKKSTKQENLSPDWCAIGGGDKDYDVDATTTGNMVESSVFFDLGAHGVRIGLNSSFDMDPIATKDNVPQFTTVRDNLVEGYGRVIPAAFGIGQGAGHDGLYEHNEIYDGYHCALSISHGGSAVYAPPDGVGEANNVLRFNLVHDVLLGIMNDGGAMRIEAGNAVFTASGNVIHDNVIHDVSDASALDNNDTAGRPHVRPGYGGDGIYLDNSTGDVEVQNNLVYRVSEMALYSPHGPQVPGRPNRASNNIFALARRAMVGINDPYFGETVPLSELEFVITDNLMYFDRGRTSTPAFFVQGGCTYPGAALIFQGVVPYRDFQLFKENVYWRKDGSFPGDIDAFHEQIQAGPSSGKSPCSRDPALRERFSFADPAVPSWRYDLKEDVGGMSVDPKFKDPENGDFRLLAGSPLPGFTPFDSSQARRTDAWYTPPAVAETFVTAPFGASDF